MTKLSKRLYKICREVCRACSIFVIATLLMYFTQSETPPKELFDLLHNVLWMVIIGWAVVGIVMMYLPSPSTETPRSN